MVLSTLYLGMMTVVEVLASLAEQYLEEADQRPGVFPMRDGSSG